MCMARHVEVGYALLYTLCHAMLCYAMLRHATLCFDMPCHAVPCCAVLCYAVLCHVMPYIWDQAVVSAYEQS